MQPSPAVSAFIQARVDAMGPGCPERGWSVGEWLLRLCKERLNALPIHSDLNFLWALRADGLVFCVDHVEGPVERESDPASLFLALAAGARRYPELAELVPDAATVTGEGAVAPGTEPGAGGSDADEAITGTAGVSADGGDAAGPRRRSAGWG